MQLINDYANNDQLEFEQSYQCPLYSICTVKKAVRVQCTVPVSGLPDAYSTVHCTYSITFISKIVQ